MPALQIYLSLTLPPTVSRETCDRLENNGFSSVHAASHFLLSPDLPAASFSTKWRLLILDASTEDKQAHRLEIDGAARLLCSGPRPRRTWRLEAVREARRDGDGLGSAEMSVRIGDVARGLEMDDVRRAAMHFAAPMRASVFAENGKKFCRGVFESTRRPVVVYKDIFAHHRQAGSNGESKKRQRMSIRGTIGDLFEGLENVPSSIVMRVLARRIVDLCYTLGEALWTLATKILRGLFWKPIMLVGLCLVYAEEVLKAVMRTASFLLDLGVEALAVAYLLFLKADALRASIRLRYMAEKVRSFRGYEVHLTDMGYENEGDF